MQTPNRYPGRRGESAEAHSYRLGALYRLRQQRAREAFDVAEAARNEGRTEGTPRFEPEPPVLPALDQVRWRRDRG